MAKQAGKLSGFKYEPKSSTFLQNEISDHSQTTFTAMGGGGGLIKCQRY